MDSLSGLMTTNRVRHVPVMENGRLAGIVSIGDVVKTRMEELQAEHEQLQAYITQGLKDVDGVRRPDPRQRADVQRPFDSVIGPGVLRRSRDAWMLPDAGPAASASCTGCSRR